MSKSFEYSYKSQPLICVQIYNLHAKFTHSCWHKSKQLITTHLQSFTHLSLTTPTWCYTTWECNTNYINNNAWIMNLPKQYLIWATLTMWSSKFIYQSQSIASQLSYLHNFPSHCCLNITWGINLLESVGTSTLICQSGTDPSLYITHC